ncbi:MAG: insulinase family protein [Planctomycetes bacterium]|nr:insulinase family protein [Planctomycetota bacterium]
MAVGVWCLGFGISGLYADETGLAQLDVKEYNLANGMKVLVLERHTAPTVACYLYFRVGSVNEQLGQTGISHLLEHMLSKGTQTIGTVNYAREKEILDQIDVKKERLAYLTAHKKGSTPDVDDQEIKGLEQELKSLSEAVATYWIPKEYDHLYIRNGAVNLNAATNQHTTYYYCSLPANKLELWCWLESDHLMNPVMRGFYEERDTVLEERHMRSEVDPGGVLWEEFESMFYKAYPLRRPIIGWRSDVSALRRKDVDDYFRKYYAPNNAVAVIVGDVKAEQVFLLMKRYFEPIERGVPVAPIVTREPEQLGERRVTVEFEAEPRLMIGYKGATIGAPEDYTMDIISAILTVGRTSRLYRELVTDKKLCLDIDTSNSAGVPGQGEGIGCFLFYAVPAQSINPAEIEPHVYAALERLKTEPVTDEELNRAKNYLAAAFVRGMDSNDGMAQTLGYNEMLCGWRYILDWLSRCQAVTKDDIRNTAAKYFIGQKRTVATMVRKPEPQINTDEHR